MQSLEVISLNVWHILISLINLLILFLILKRFLYKPVRKVLANREAELEESYLRANEAEARALKNEESWNVKMRTAKKEAEEITLKARRDAEARSDKMILLAKEQVQAILSDAESETKALKRRAEAELRSDTAKLAAELAEKILKREIDEKDHSELIDSFIMELGREDEQDS